MFVGLFGSVYAYYDVHFEHVEFSIQSTSIWLAVVKGVTSYG